MVLLVPHLGHLHALVLEVDHVWMYGRLLLGLVVHLGVASPERLLLLRILLEETLGRPILTAVSSLLLALHRIRIRAMLRERACVEH